MEKYSENRGRHKESQFMIKNIFMKKVSARIFRIRVSNIVAAYRKIEKTAKEVVSF